MEKPDMDRRGFLKGLAGVAAGSVIGNEAIAREPDVTREVGSFLQFGTYYDFIARFNQEAGTDFVPIALVTGETMVLRFRVGGVEQTLTIFEEVPLEGQLSDVTYAWFRAKMLQYLGLEI